MPYYAHSLKNDPDRSRWQPLAEHLIAVARLAEQFARDARPGDNDFACAAWLAGLLHDLGKYRDEFQAYLDPKGAQVRSASTDHAAYGASAGAFRFESDGIAFAVAGHHAGLHDAGQLASLLEGSRYHASTRFVELLKRAECDCADFAALVGALTLDASCDAGRRRYEFATRMLFSLLVDADRLDTERWERSQANP